MKTLRPGIFLVAVFLVAAASLTAQTDGTKLDYPKAKTVDQVDDYHGVKVADPYRWLEDADSNDTQGMG